jgi:hypothetical protein
MPVILAMQEAKMDHSPGQSRHKVNSIPKIMKAKRASGMAQVMAHAQGPWFNPQYWGRGGGGRESLTYSVLG